MQNNITNPASQPSASPLNKRVGRFYLTEKLGVGSNGTVFRGHDPVIDRDVAIKILNTIPNAADRKQREQQFINEARAAGRLSHPSIVTIFDASSEGGTTFIAMEFLPGQDLRQMLATGKSFDIIETATIIQKIADALTVAHANGVIHRDIKPGNIFILPNNHPKVVDFGIARAPNRLIDENRPADVTLFNNNVLGTPNYMSPEQAMGKQVTALTDVYSLGAVMYEMLTGQKPFQSNDIDKLLHQIANKQPKSPTEIHSGIPESLSKIVTKAMQKDLTLRYQSTEEMSQALYRFLERDKKLKQKGGRSKSAPDRNEKKKEGINSLLLLSGIAVIVAIAAIIVSKFAH
ncbi:serine/threonine protein kinase [Undibacterium sp. SXout11W]|uniref:serine/threonine protein kinase n=1 Tax=Undibacterium sp. SXout11W TaxID=3413050 RepID=UPI003BF3F668